VVTGTWALAHAAEAERNAQSGSQQAGNHSSHCHMQ
jgi:hypothetical protein